MRSRNALGFYIGVRSVDNTSTAEAILEKSFKGNFAGSQIQAIPQEEVQKVLGSINKSGRFGTRQNVSSVSIVPSTRDEDKERFVQGIEKFIDTMKGSEYTAVFIAEPLDRFTTWAKRKPQESSLTLKVFARIAFQIPTAFYIRSLKGLFEDSGHSCVQRPASIKYFNQSVKMLKNVYSLIESERIDVEH